MNNLKCAVIGASGFIGLEIAKYLISKGDEVVCFDIDTSCFKKHEDLNFQFLDITDSQSCNDKLIDFDEVYNCAGVLGTSELNEMITTAVKVNIMGALNVFNACVSNKIPRVFYPSKPNPWLNTYTITKEASEKFSQLYNESCDNTKIISMRWFNAYGPNQHTHPVRKIGPTFSLIAKERLPINIFGSGNNVVDLITAKDIAKWSVEATRNNFWEKVYDLGRGIPVTVKEFATEVNKVSGNTSGFEFVEMREGEDEDTILVADISELKERFQNLGIKMEFEDYQASIKEMYDFYASIPDEDRQEILNFHGLIKEDHND